MSKGRARGQQISSLTQVLQALETLKGQANRLGAVAGAQRIELLIQQHDELYPQDSYHFLDLDSMQREIEEAQNGHWYVVCTQIIRHIASLTPLIWTWAGLWLAVNNYQDFLSTHTGKADQQVPFLTLWQDGFHHTTGFTFGFTAMGTIIFLITYLGTILLSQFVDIWAQRRAATFINNLSEKTRIFVELALRSRVVTATNPDDVKTIAQAVKQVIDGAIEETRQVVQGARAAVQRVETHAKQAINDSNTRLENMLTGQVTPLLQTFDTNTQTLNRQLNRLPDLVGKLASSTNTMQESVTSLLNDGDRNYKLGTEIDTHLQALHQGEQAVAEQLLDMTIQVTSAAGGMTQASTQVERVATSMEATNQQIDQGLQTTLARMTVSDQNAATFQQELKEFYGQLDNFRATLQELIATSNELGGNMHTYTNLGEQIQQQVKALAQSEADILTQFKNTSYSMDAVVQNIDSAATTMGQTKDSLVDITQRLQQNTQATHDTMMNNIGRATLSLGNVEKQLSGASNGLLQVTNQLAALPQTVTQFAPLQQTVAQLTALQQTLARLAAALQASSQQTQPQANNGAQSPWGQVFTPGTNRTGIRRRP